MKKVILFSLFAIIISVLSSCIQQPTQKAVTVTKTTKTTVTEPGSDGFLLSKQIVVKGNTIWGFSEKAYGTGLNWRDIVSQNLFLQQPGRVYYDDSRKMWIVKIFPGEVVKIGNEVITPSYFVEETTTTTTTEPVPTTASIASDMPWWGWLLVLLVIAGLVAAYFRSPSSISNSSSNSSSHSNSESGAIRVDVNDRCNIDAATRSTLLGREQDFRGHTLDILERGARKHGRLISFAIDEDDDRFLVKAEYSDRFRRNEKVNEDKGKS